MKIEKVDHIIIDLPLPNGDTALLSIFWNSETQVIMDMSYKLQVHQAHDGPHGE